VEDELTNFRILRYFLNKEGNIFLPWSNTIEEPLLVWCLQLYKKEGVNSKFFV
jgi:hypothetical protein